MKKNYVESQMENAVVKTLDQQRAEVIEKVKERELIKSMHKPLTSRPFAAFRFDKASGKVVEATRATA